MMDDNMKSKNLRDCSPDILQNQSLRDLENKPKDEEVNFGKLEIRVVHNVEFSKDMLGINIMKSSEEDILGVTKMLICIGVMAGFGKKS